MLHRFMTLEVTSFTRSKYIEGVPKFKKVGHKTLTTTQFGKFIIHWLHLL